MIRKKLFVLFFIAGFALMSMTPADEVMTKEGNTYIVNTTMLCDKKGFRDKTPLLVYIKGDKIIKVEALKNRESPSYFNKVKKALLPLYENMKIGKAIRQTDEEHIDGCTGATYSSLSVQANIRAALEYYNKVRH